MRERIESDLSHVEVMLDRFMRVDEYLQTLSSSGFSLNDEIVIDVLAFQLAQAGEQLAQDKLSEETRERFPDINWREIKKNRNFITHSYVKKRNIVLVKMIEQDVPVYIEQLQRVRSYLLGILEDGVEQ